MRNIFMYLSAICLLASPLQANIVVAEKYIPNAEQVGMGRLSFMLWDVYDATFYAPNGKWDVRKPYALSIRYLLQIKGVDIAKRSVEEMEKQGFSDSEQLTRWQEQMAEIFPDVENGTELTAIYTPGKFTDFYDGGKHIGRIEGAAFGTQFFNIWLSEKTSEPELRNKLLGLL